MKTENRRKNMQAETSFLECILKQTNNLRIKNTKKGVWILDKCNELNNWRHLNQDMPMILMLSKVPVMIR